MKIACISDLHVPKEQIAEYIDTINLICKEEQVEVLLIAGDIFEDYKIVELVINELNNGNHRTYFIPGNHDLWSKDSCETSEDIYRLYLNNPYCLLNRSISLTEQYNVIGHIGWYDYTLGNQQIYDKSDFDKMRIDHRIWNDKNYSSFTKNNIEICEKFNQEIETLINQDKKDKIIMTHMISNPSFIVLDDPNRSNIEYFSAFCGSTKLYDLTKDERVKYAISGHVHYRMNFIENNTEYICACLGSQREWTLDKNNNLYNNIKRTLQYINI